MTHVAFIIHNVLVRIVEDRDIPDLDNVGSGNIVSEFYDEEKFMGQSCPAILVEINPSLPVYSHCVL